MNTYNNEYLNNLKNEILKMTEIEWINIYNLIKDNNIPFTKNNNGVFVNMSDLTEPCIEKIKSIIDFYEKISDNTECRKKKIEMMNN